MRRGGADPKAASSAMRQRRPKLADYKAELAPTRDRGSRSHGLTSCRPQVREVSMQEGLKCTEVNPWSETRS